GASRGPVGRRPRAPLFARRGAASDCRGVARTLPAVLGRHARRARGLRGGGRVITLVVRRTIRATPERLFDAWTDPAQLVRWWGPKGVVCTHAEIDLCVGGRYRLAHRFPDGGGVWVTGEFRPGGGPAAPRVSRRGGAGAGG